MVVDTVEQGDHWVIGEGTFNLGGNKMSGKNPEKSKYLIGMPLVEAKLAISVGVVRVVAAALVLLILHEVEIPADNTQSHINIST